MIKAIALSFGYVESNSTSWLIYEASRRYPTTRKEAILSLAEYLYQKFQMQLDERARNCDADKDHMAKCCQRAWQQRDRANPPTNCPKCSADFSVKPDSFDSEDDWIEFLREVERSNCDSYGDHDDVPNPDGWTPWLIDFNYLQHEMVIVGENAEQMLTMAVRENHPELWPDSDLSVEDNYLGTDWRMMCDESTTIVNGRYCHLHELNELVMVGEGEARLQKATNRIIATTVYDYPNGAQAIVIDGQLDYIRYNTGDQTWFKDGQPDHGMTHDGVGWNNEGGQVQPH